MKLEKSIFDYRELQRAGIPLASYVRTFEQSLAFDDIIVYVIKED